MQKYNIFIDGASKNNPGKAGAGFLITQHNRGGWPIGWPIAAGCIPLGIMTNNKAEYSALIYALESLCNHGLLNSKITIYTDSQLIDGHLMRGWKIKDHMRPYVERCRELLLEFDWSIIKIPRNENEVADYLSNLGVKMNG